jgi:flagellar protein FliT
MNANVVHNCEAYERVAQLTAAMLTAARASRWEELIALEAECKAVFAAIVNAPADPDGSPALARRKAELIQQVLADDAEIRTLVEPWMAELSQWLGTRGRTQRLHHAYGAGG